MPSIFVERGHPRNRILIDSENNRQAIVDTTGLTWQMLGAARVAMDGRVLDYIEEPDMRPQDILVAYARAQNDPSHVGRAWRTIPHELRSGTQRNEQTRFTSFYFALRRWRLDSARFVATHDWRSLRRYSGPGLLYIPGRESTSLTPYTHTSAWPAQWQIVPAADADDYSRRWSISTEEMTLRALRAAGLNADEIAAEWPRGTSADASDRFDLSPIRYARFR
ncbi:MAG: hypothetical protein WD382_00590 [Halofilum sp. (in: g-proteobacteria)]